MGTTRGRLAVLVVSVVSVATLGACAGSASEPASEPASGPAPAPATATATARSAGSSTPADDADVIRLGRLASTAGHLTPTELGQLPVIERARVLAPCAELSWGAFYCLGLGFRDDRPDYEVLLASTSAADAGDLPFRSWVDERVAMPLDERLAEQAAEVDGAILGLDKARSIAGGGPG